MATVTADSKVCLDRNVKEAAMKVEQALHDAKTAVGAKLEDVRAQAERLGKRGRYAVKDEIREATHRIQRHPFNALAIAFAAGSFCGFLAPHLMGRKKRSSWR
jgi:ElaB/YqjD/DUF883 family membrane-anchored ribosome-binding protein